MCLNPDGLNPVPEVVAAVADAGKRLRDAGWIVEEVADTPSLREAAEIQTRLWLGDGYEAQLAFAEREGDPGALACLRGVGARVHPFDLSQALTRRATLDARMVRLPRQISGAADAGLRRVAVPGSSRPQGRGVVRAGVARATAADRDPVHGPSGARRLHGAWSGGFRSACSWWLRVIARTSALPRARRSRPAARRRRQLIRGLI